MMMTGAAVTHGQVWSAAPFSVPRVVVNLATVMVFYVVNLSELKKKCKKVVLRLLYLVHDTICTRFEISNREIMR